jgi:site-specific recombinase XerD
MKVLFWHRKNKVNSIGEAAIYGRITINKVRGKDFSTGIFCKLGQFDARRQLIVPSGDDDYDRTKLKNIKLRRLETKIDSLFLELENRDIVITPEILGDYVLGKRKFEVTILQAIKEYLQHRESEVRKQEISPNTLNRHEDYCKNLKLFLEEKYSLSLPLKVIRPKLAYEFYDWMRLKAEKMHSSKTVAALKGIMQIAVLNEHIKYNCLADLTFKRGSKKKIIFLDPEELSLLESHKFFSQKLQHVADLFIFQCYTGFSYMDLDQFNPSKHIITDQDNYLWILKPRGKTEIDSQLPLFPGAKRIIDKYTSLDIFDKKTLKLPLISLQKYNEYIKEVAEIVGIRYKLTTHIGRKTFGMITLNDGFSLEAVSKMLGHKSIKTTQDHYAVVLNRRIITEFYKLQLKAV